MKQSILFLVAGKSMETETTSSEFHNEGKAIVEHILALEEINPEELYCESHNQGSEYES